MVITKHTLWEGGGAATTTVAATVAAEEFPGRLQPPSHHVQGFNILFGHTPRSDSTLPSEQAAPQRMYVHYERTRVQ